MAVAAALAGAASCNSSSTSEAVTELDGSAIVKSFTLVENEKVLPDLDSVFFAIDLVNGEIYNADSLPKGTRIAALAATITTDNASAVTLYIPRPGKTDSIVDYLQHTTDTIDFSNGPVRLEVVSLNGLTKKNYNVRVNVHNVVSDSLCWGSTAFAPLAAPAGTVKQRTVKQGSYIYTFGSTGSSYSLAATGDMAAWQQQAFTPGFDMDVNTITATEDAFYALSEADGTLYSATAPAGPWTSRGIHFHHLYGGYGTELLGLCTDVNNQPGIVSYPSMRQVDAPEGFPVAGTSPAVTLEAPMATSAQMIIVGGIDSDGGNSADAYGYDGTRWARLTSDAGKRLPKALSGIALAPYYSLRARVVEWKPEVFPTLLTFGGREESGEINTVVYMSRDWGMNWVKADSLLQPGPDMPATHGAQALVESHTMNVARSAALWTETGMPCRLPVGARLEGAAASRAIAPVTEWEAPYIYLVGGYDASGNLNAEMWRGVINRFTFTPIQ